MECEETPERHIPPECCSVIVRQILPRHVRQSLARQRLKKSGRGGRLPPQRTRGLDAFGGCELGAADQDQNEDKAVAGRRAPAYRAFPLTMYSRLSDATENHSTLFEQPLFNFLSLMHRTYGVHVDLYLFNRATVNGRMAALCDVAERFRGEFQEAQWLRLGPHALEYHVPPHRQAPAEQIETFDETYREIERFAGPGKTTGFVRLHFFSETYEVASYLLRMGVHTPC